MQFLRNVFFVFCCYFCVTSAKRIKCSDIITTERGYNENYIKFTLKIPLLNNTDKISTRVHISGPKQIISHVSLSQNEDPKEGRTINENQAEVHYILTYAAFSRKPIVARIEVATSDKCISYCEGSRDIRANIVFGNVSDTFRLFGKTDASTPHCIEYEPMFSPLPENCGVTVDGRIYSGSKLERGAWPWLAPMFIRTIRGLHFKCGANIISSRTLITAAHCVMNPEGTVYNAQDILVSTGRHDISNFNEGGYWYHTAEEIVVHPEYKRNHQPDIALINLPSEIEFTNFIQPVCLWSDPAPVTGQIGVVAGWGVTENKTVSREPLYVESTIVDTDECKASSSIYHERDLSSTICAGDLDGSGPCRGDSGGGLILVDKNQRFSLRGLVSMTLGDEETSECYLTNYVLYSDVAKYYYWIRSKMW